MKDQEPRPRVLYPESITPSRGYDRAPQPDVFGRTPAHILEIQEMLDIARFQKPAQPEPKPPKGRNKNRK